MILKVYDWFLHNSRFELNKNKLYTEYFMEAVGCWKGNGIFHDKGKWKKILLDISSLLSLLPLIGICFYISEIFQFDQGILYRDVITFSFTLHMDFHNKRPFGINTVRIVFMYPFIPAFSWGRRALELIICKQAFVLLVFYRDRGKLS